MEIGTSNTSLVLGWVLTSDGDAREVKQEFRFCPTWCTFNIVKEDTILHRNSLASALQNGMVSERSY